MSDESLSRPQPSRWTRVASLGLLLSAAGALTLVVAVLAFGVDSEGGPWFVLVFTSIPLLGAFLVNGTAVRWKVVGIVAGFLTAGALFWTAFGLVRPTSFFDFVPAVLVLPGALVGLGASVAALLRRDTEAARNARGEQAWLRAMLTVAGVAVLGSSLLTVVSRRSADLSKANFAVRMADFEFDRSTYELVGGTTLYVRNDDPFFHTFTVDELRIDVSLDPGSSALIKIPPQSGIYFLYCRPHVAKDDPTNKGMASTLRVL
jgi:plastocyanin